MNDDVQARLDVLERRQALLRQELAGLDEVGNLVAILTPHGEDAIRPLRNFAGGGFTS